MSDGQDSLERAIVGALKGAIRDHGPITADKITSAAKRVAGNLKNARLDGIAAALGRKGGAAGTGKAKRRDIEYAALGRKGGKAKARAAKEAGPDGER